MTTKTLDDVMRRILNDPSIFSPPYDRNAGSAIPLLFETEDWKRLKEAFDSKDRDSFNYIVDNQCLKIRQKEQNARGWRKKQIDKVISLGEALKRTYEEKTNLMKQLFEMFDSFGYIECNLPNMEDYGKVIENYSLPTVEQYFLSKIDRASDYQKCALRKTMEYLKELYSMNLDILEIAFFIRKLNSLTQFMEVIKDE